MHKAKDLSSRVSAENGKKTTGGKIVGKSRSGKQPGARVA